MSETEKLIGFEKVLAESARQLKAEREETRKHIAQLEAEIEFLKKEAEPFRAQIDQRKTYKAHDEQS